MRTVAVKTEEQQAMLGLHRMRQQLVKFRTMQVNQVRGLLYEFGATFKAGRQAKRFFLHFYKSLRQFIRLLGF